MGETIEDQTMEFDETNQKAPMDETVLLVQHDWNLVRPENKETFFVGYRKSNEKTKFFDVNFNKDSNEFQNDSFKCKKLPNNALSLEFGGDLNVRKTFIGPSSEYDQVHKAAVSTLDVSSSGNLVVSADSYSGLLVWNTENGEVLRELQAHILDVNRCRFFPSGLVILSGGMDMTVRIWSVENGECARIMKGHKAPILDLAIIDRGEEVLTCARDGTVRKWNCGSGECVATLSLPSGSANCLALNSEHLLLIAGTDNGKIYIYDADSKKAISDLFLGTACISLAARDNYVFVGGENGTIFIIDLKTNTILQRLKVGRGKVQRLEVVPGGLLASFADGGVCLYDDFMTSAQSKIEFTGADCDAVYDFSITSKYLFTGCRDKIIRKYAVPELLHSIVA